MELSLHGGDPFWCHPRRYFRRLEMPFGELVDWENAIVRIGEADLATMESEEELLSRLPGEDQHQMEQMDRNVLAVRERFFASSKGRERGIRKAIRRRITCMR